MAVGADEAETRALAVGEPRMGDILATFDDNRLHAVAVLVGEAAHKIARLTGRVGIGTAEQ